MKRQSHSTWRPLLAVAMSVTLANGSSALDAPPPVWRQADGHRHAALAVPASGRAGFAVMLPETTGITFTNVLSAERSITNQIPLNGSGVALGDVAG